MSNNNLQLTVTNFGPIAKAEIALRPLTVFVGPSNTGKSYLATLIYALHKFFNGDATVPWLGYRESAFQQSIIKDMSDEDAHMLIDWAPELLAKMDREEFCITVPEPIASLIRPSLQLRDLDDKFTNELVRDFGVKELHNVIRHGTKHSVVAVTRPTSVTSPCSAPFTYTWQSNILTTEDVKVVDHLLSAIIPKNAPLQIMAYDIPHQFRDNRSRLQSLVAKNHFRTRFLNLTRLTFENILVDLVGSSIVAPFTRGAYYLPAGRSNLMHLQRVIASSLAFGASQVIQSHNVSPGLSGVLSDFIGRLYNLDDVTNTATQFSNEMSQRLETTILRGSITTRALETGNLEYSYRPEGWNENIPLMNSSSMVSELAPVVLYLRHVVKPGEVLIIEEPEAHLHPGMQVEFIRQLAAAVRAGVRVMLTTHSEWVLEELANLVRLSDLSESQLEGVEGGDVAITQDEVGVWLFRHDDASGGSEVKEIPLDQEQGGFASGYDDVAMDTYNKWARIGNLLSGARNGS